jgi:hypothetical protein
VALNKDIGGSTWEYRWLKTGILFNRWRVLTATPKVAVQDKTLSLPLKVGHPQLYEPINPRL